MTTFDLSGKTALVTGGNGGIGLGMATSLAQAGMDVAIWGTNEDKNAAAKDALAAHGTKVEAYICDVADEEQVVASTEQVVSDFGRIDSTFANSGIGRMAPFAQMSLKQWRRVMSVNLDGAFLTLRESVKHMVERGEGGALVAVSSVSAVHGAPGMQHYAASKAGLSAMMRGLAVELARHQIRVNTILPGWTATDMNKAGREGNEKFNNEIIRRTPIRRWGDPSELGPVAVFLADPSLMFHTGDELIVDGGYTKF